MFCDQTTAGGGWTVFQKRLDGSVNFYRGWADYKRGFGNLNGEFWLGLDKLHRLTKSKNRLRVDLEDTAGKTVYAEYSMFAVTSERAKYQLSLGTYTGNFLFLYTISWGRMETGFGERGLWRCINIPPPVVIRPVSAYSVHSGSHLSRPLSRFRFFCYNLRSNQRIDVTNDFHPGGGGGGVIGVNFCGNGNFMIPT